MMVTAPITPITVRLEEVSFGYDKRRILDGVSVVFPEGKVTVVVGKSGSGKSTLLELINGMNIPAGGVVKLSGEPLDYSRIREQRLEIGYVVQRFGLFPHMTVAANIGLPGVLKKMPARAIDGRVRELMDLVKLPAALWHRYPYALSGGEQQRVALCRALLLNPPLLLMDEPFASLDYATKHAIYVYFRALQRSEPRTVVLVTHDWEEARLLADRVVWIEGGRIRQQGGPADLDGIGEAYRQDV
jgi:osmoprotectant transport system ATP-binding protein